MIGKFCFVFFNIGVLFKRVVMGVVFNVVDIGNRCRFLCKVFCIFRLRVRFKLLFKECLWNLLNKMVEMFVSFGLLRISCVNMFLVIILICVCVLIWVFMWM